jgi:exonuclease SbcC
MNRESVEKLSNNLRNVQMSEDGHILKVEYVFKENLAAVYYIDFANEELNPDIDTYLEKHISSDYYNHPGYLQWNYYLIFLREENYINTEIKKTIEKNDTYARKFVFTPEELKSYFEYKRSDKGVDVDIVSIWKEKLREVDLHEVYASTSYTEAVPRFITNAVIREDSTETAGSSTASFVIRKISNLEFENTYRPYPKRRTFSFGIVNLIKGVNGSGKSSLLEGIELIIAGKNYREPTFQESNKSITASYNGMGTEVDSYTPTDNTKYRNRDIQWYSSGYKTGNDLYIAFNKYNFYDSDAAYHLSYDSDISSLSKYLSSIALGSEFIRIQDRLKGFNERLSKELRDRNKIIREEEDNKKKAEETLTAIKLTSNPQANLNAFVEFSKEVKWLAKIPETMEAKADAFEADYLTAQSNITSLNQLISSLKLLTLKSWKLELEKISQAVITCKNSKQEIQLLSKQIKDRETSLKEDNFKLSFLIQAETFYLTEDSFQLQGLEQRIILLSANVSKYERVLKQVDEIIDKTTLLSGLSLLEYKTRLIDENNRLKSSSKQIKEQIDTLKSNLNKLEVVVTDIKSLGKQYLNLNNNANSCPLCDTPYSFEALSIRISKISESIQENVAIDILNGQLLSVTDQLEKSESSLRDIITIENAIVALQPTSDYSRLKLSEIDRDFNAAKLFFEQDKTELLKYSLLKKSLEEKGLSESQFDILKNNIETYFPELKFSVGSKQLFLDLLNKIKKSIEDITKLNTSDSEKVKDLKDRLIEQMNGIINNTQFDSLEQDLEYKKSLLEKGLSYFANIGSIMSFNEDEDFNDLQQAISKLYAFFEKYRKSISEQKDLALANGILGQSLQRLAELEPQVKRINSGLDVINDILTNHNETKILSEFLNNNEDQIQEIFENIHSPKEFSKIVFNYATGAVLLRRKISSQDVPLTKISSGQRSALALSIFIALNKKLKNGPNVIIFDDPVTYTDDLNILSFLDYLRELIIHEDRQLFFATANFKLASLFEKKFGFLGETDLQVYPLER